MDTIKMMAEQMATQTTMEKNHLELAKQLIELKYSVKVISIEFEDGSGRSFNIVAAHNPLKKIHIRL
jgi:hypothetical protein